LNRGSSSNGQKDSNTATGGKAALDVEAFKRLLLTGNTGNSVSSPPSTKENGSSTDTSSVSRQSIFEPVHDAHVDSPHSSIDHSRSENGDNTDDDDEHSSLVGESSSKASKSPPPRHKHGNTLKLKGPQTVSFAEFDASFPSPVSAQSPRMSQITQSSRPSLHRSTSDLNKPLPARPQESSSPEEDRPHVPVKDSEIESLRSSNSSSSIVVELPKKAQPPPPPAARRQGNAKSGSADQRPRSSSNLTQSSINEDTIEKPKNYRAAPPPPLPRSRSSYSQSSVVNQEQAANVSDGQSTATIPHDPPTSVREQSAERSTPKPKPPPPPSRLAMKTNNATLTRTASVQSTSSTGNRRISPSTATTAPPPPPPRRSDVRRTSNDGDASQGDLRRSSIDSRRSSTEYRRHSGQHFDPGRRGSVSSLQRVVEDGGYPHQGASFTGSPITSNDGNGAQSQANDLLADLSAFQREVDELRARARKGA